MDSFNKNATNQLALTKKIFWLLLLGFVITWWLSASLSKPYLDSYGDMTESYVWSQTWMLGSFKHPPLMAWVVKIWFSIFPETVFAYFLLSYINSALGILGIVAIAHFFLPETVSPYRKKVVFILVLTLTFLSFPYSNLAGKFNADTILLSLWPWTTYAFFRAIHAGEKKQQLLWSLALGGLGALAMLGKYYSGVLLLAFVLTTCCHKTYWRWYLSIYPYLAVIFFLLCLLPHAVWEFYNDFPLQQYLLEEVEGEKKIHYQAAIKFFLSGIYYLILTWIWWCAFRFKNMRTNNYEKGRPLFPLLLLCVFPALITISLHVFFGFHLTVHWTIPIWFGVPALLGVLLLPYIGDGFNIKRLAAGFSVLFLAILLLSIVYIVTRSSKGEARYTFDRKAMAIEVMQSFNKAFPDEQLAWVGGTWPYSAAVSFFSDNHPRGLPEVPDEFPATVNPYSDWEKGYGAILCVAATAFAAEGSINQACRQNTLRWLKKHNLPIIEQTVTFQATGWQFLQAKRKNIQVFWVVPKSIKRVSNE